MDKHTITPSACAEFLRNYNHWRRGGLASQPDPIELGKHIDAAIELIKQRDELLAALKALSSASRPVATALFNIGQPSQDWPSIYRSINELDAVRGDAMDLIAKAEGR